MYSKIEHVKLILEFNADYQLDPPILEIKNNNQLLLKKTEITESRKFEFDLSLVNDRCLPVSLEIIRSNFNGIDQQIVTLDKIYLDDINLSKICYQAKYYPIYPEPWISEQRDIGVEWPEYLTGVSSWGWNGVWKLDYETPIYTWLLKNV
jgi:hypothetical protein